MATRQPAPFAGRLLQWWRQHGRHDLPWQVERNAYKVWLSEVMLQQTQVSTVIPYYLEFLQTFPTLADLAAADLDAVLARWSGLGYYSRARNLHKTAQICMQQHAGELPCDLERLRDLPGIGRSTAAAILAQTWNQPATILDGNVKRVLARHRAISGWPGKSAVAKQLWAAAEAFTPDTDAADYTQAIMDLGATLCLRSKPQCADCPVSADCKAFQDNSIDQFPGKRPRRKLPQKTTQMLLATNQNGQILLTRRPPSGIWGGLWSLPEYQQPQEIEQQHGIKLQNVSPYAKIPHTFTHFKLTIAVQTATATQAGNLVQSADETRWFSPAQALKAGLPKPVRSLLEQYLETTEKLL